MLRYLSRSRVCLSTATARKIGRPGVVGDEAPSSDPNSNRYIYFHAIAIYIELEAYINVILTYASNPSSSSNLAVIVA